MKKVILKVEIEVDNDYIINGEDWLLEDAVIKNKYEYCVSLMKDNN